MLDRLHTFCVVVEEGSFRKAAAKLFLSQPSVSQQIAQLERQLQVKLFDRSGHRATLAPGGKTLYALAQEILTRARSLPEVLAEYRDLSTGTLELGVVVDLGITHLPGVLKKFIGAFPLINVNIASGSVEVLLDAVEKGAIEIAIMGRDPNRKTDDRITWKTIFTEPLILVGSPNVAAFLPVPISADDFEKVVCIGYSHKSPLYTFLNDFALRNQLKFERKVLVDEPAIALSLAEQSVGLALVGESSAGEALGRGSLVAVEYPGADDMQWEIQVAYHTHRGLGYAGWMLLRHLQTPPESPEE
jgi:DNA-binding transcriptional LysR family regulator